MTASGKDTRLPCHCARERVTHSTHKNNTVALINKIRVTTATQLGVHVEEDKDRTSKRG